MTSRLVGKLRSLFLQPLRLRLSGRSHLEYDSSSKSLRGNQVRFINFERWRRRAFLFHNKVQPFSFYCIWNLKELFLWLEIFIRLLRVSLPWRMVTQTVGATCILSFHIWVKTFCSGRVTSKRCDSSWTVYFPKGPKLKLKLNSKHPSNVDLWNI